MAAAAAEAIKLVPTEGDQMVAPAARRTAMEAMVASVAVVEEVELALAALAEMPALEVLGGAVVVVVLDIHSHLDPEGLEGSEAETAPLQAPYLHFLLPAQAAVAAGWELAFLS